MLKNTVITLFSSFAVFLFASVPTNAASVTFNPTNISMEKGATGTVDVNLDLQSDSSIGAEIYISFDKSKINFNTIVASNTVTPDIISQDLGNSSGILNIAFADAETPYTGSFKIATLNFTALNSGQTVLEVLTAGNQSSTVAEYYTSDELLTSAGSATITINTSGGSGDDDDDNDNDSSSGDDDNDDNDNDGNSNDNVFEDSGDSGSTTPTGAVPETGTSKSALFAITSFFLLGASLTLKKLFI